MHSSHDRKNSTDRSLDRLEDSLRSTVTHERVLEAIDAARAELTAVGVTPAE